MISALFVETDGCYFNLPDVDPWDIERDATKYDGSNPVVAHPPCNVWSPLAPLAAARYGTPVKEDGGLFAFALKTVQRYGGVLEHPARSMAWKHFGIPTPSINKGWILVGAYRDKQAWTCCVEQGNYGHTLAKATWLLYVGRRQPPQLRWGRSTRKVDYTDAPYTKAEATRLLKPRKESGATAAERRAFIKWYDQQTGKKHYEHTGEKERLATPPAFRDVLIELAKWSRLPLEDFDDSRVRDRHDAHVPLPVVPAQ